MKEEEYKYIENGTIDSLEEHHGWKKFINDIEERLAIVVKQVKSAPPKTLFFRESYNGEMTSVRVDGVEVHQGEMKTLEYILRWAQIVKEENLENCKLKEEEEREQNARREE